MTIQERALGGEASPAARLDRLPVTRIHIVWISILGFGYLIEMYDNVVFAYLAPTIRAEWDLSLGQVGLVTSAVFVGMMFGAVGGGRLSDRYGRKPVLIWASVFYSLTSLMSALAPNYELLLASRVLTGIGVQAGAGVILVYISEVFPVSSRGRFFTVMMFFGSFATPLTSIAALTIAPTGIGMWRFVFAIGSVGIVIAVLVAIRLPESVRWLTANGRDASAHRIVARLESVASRKGDLPPVAHEPAPLSAGSYRDLLAPRYLRRLALLCSAFCLFVFCLYGFSSWLPTVLVGRGMAQADALRMGSISSFGAVAAPILLFAVSDRIERKTALLASVVIGGAGMVVFGQTGSPAVTLVSAIVIQTALTTATTSFYTYIPEVFPTHIRGVGAGVVSGVARLGGIASGVAVAAIYSRLGDARLYLILGVALCFVGVVLAVFGPRTTGRSLENISDD